MKVLIPQDISEVGKIYLRDCGYEVQVLHTFDEATLFKEVAGYDALLVRNARITRKVLEEGSRLKVIAKHGVGVDNIDLQAARELGIQVTNAPESNANCVAEHTVAMIMAMAHQLPFLDVSVRKSDWDVRNRINLLELLGKTAGIVGLGKIGKLVAEKLSQGLGMKIIAYNRSVPKDLPFYIEMKKNIDEIYAEADVVSIHVPATPETKKSVNLSCFQKMKNSALLINSGRGEVVDEEDLYQALSDGMIAGAALDVLEKEPPETGNPLLSCNRVLLSPHCGAHSQESFEKMALHAAMGVHEVLSGKTVTWPVC